MELRDEIAEALDLKAEYGGPLLLRAGLGQVEWNTELPGRIEAALRATAEACLSEGEWDKGIERGVRAGAAALRGEPDG